MGDVGTFEEKVQLVVAALQANSGEGKSCQNTI
jgi:hypothetical protein